MSKWPAFPLEELVEGFLDGDWIEKKDQSSKGIRLLQTGNVGLGVFRSNDRKARFIDHATFDRLKCEEVRPGDVLVSRLPDPIGRACIIPELDGRLITAVDCTIIRFKEQLMREFFIHYSLSPQYLRDVQQQATGTTRPRISRARLGKINIPLPPLDEQKRIVAKLDEAQSNLDRLTENYQNQTVAISAFGTSALNRKITLGQTGSLFSSAGSADNLSDSEPLASAASWPKVRLGDVARIINGRAYSKEELLDSGRYRVLRVGNFFGNRSWYWSDLELAADKYCEPGDLLYAWSASFGPRIWAGERAIFHYHIWNIKEDATAVDRHFLFWWLTWDVEKIKAAAGTGSTMMHVTKSSMEARVLTLPPLFEQRKIVVELDALRQEQDSYRKRLDQRRSLSSAFWEQMLSSVFQGNTNVSE